jgi:tetratricopeptide (TPR) repeat protein
MIKSIIAIFSFSMIVLLPEITFAQPDYPFYRKGDKDYERGLFEDAETAYRKANEVKPKPEASYNLGNSIYEQNRLPEAISQYEKAIESAKDPALKSRAYYNKGNAHFQNKEYDKSIEAYKNALKLMPTDEDAKKNLMLAMRQLQQQQQQQQQKDQQNNQDKKDQENKDQQQPQDEQDQKQNPQDEQDQKQNQPQESKSQPGDDQPPPEGKEDISKEEAKDILKAVEREDQRVQEKLKKVSGRNAPPVKDW